MLKESRHNYSYWIIWFIQGIQTAKVTCVVKSQGCLICIKYEDSKSILLKIKTVGSWRMQWLERTLRGPWGSDSDVLELSSGNINVSSVWTLRWAQFFMSKDKLSWNKINSIKRKKSLLSCPSKISKLYCHTLMKVQMYNFLCKGERKHSYGGK